jgi:hypothetical protein
VFNPIATEGPGMMQSPFAGASSSSVKATSPKEAKEVQKAVKALVTPAPKPAKQVVAQSLKEQGYDFDSAAAAKKEVSFVGIHSVS